MIDGQVFEADHPDLALLPEPTRNAVDAAFRSEPERGQLWRVLWGGYAPRLALVLDVGDAFTVVAPVSMDPDHRVDAAVVVTDTPIGVPLVIWPQARTGLGDFVLADCFGAFDDATTQELVDRARRRTTEQDLAEWNAGLSEDEVDARRLHRDRLAHEFAVLCDSDWSDADLYDEPEEFLDSDAARRAALTLRLLAETVGLSVVDAGPVWLGEQPLPPGAREALAGRFGAAAADAISAVPTNRAARSVLDSPTVRARVVEVAVLDQQPEATTRRGLYRNMVGAPGRETGPKDERDYRERLRMLLDARLG